jgi:hypothetical protein
MKQELQRSARVTAGISDDGGRFVVHSSYPLSMEGVRGLDDDDFLYEVTHWLCGYAPWVDVVEVVFPNGEEFELDLIPRND